MFLIRVLESVDSGEIASLVHRQAKDVSIRQNRVCHLSGLPTTRQVRKGFVDTAAFRRGIATFARHAGFVALKGPQDFHDDRRAGGAIGCVYPDTRNRSGRIYKFVVSRIPPLILAEFRSQDQFQP
jgi:hypothetical protein